MYPRLIRTQRIRPWFLYTPPVAICDGFHVELSGDEPFGQLKWLVKIEQYLESRRDRSRNKVAVGEPAAGSFMMSLFRLHLRACGFVDNVSLPPYLTQTVSSFTRANAVLILYSFCSKEQKTVPHCRDRLRRGNTLLRLVRHTGGCSEV